MSISPERKQEVIKEFATKVGDTGSPEVQVAIITERIRNLSYSVHIYIKHFIFLLGCKTDTKYR